MEKSGAADQGLIQGMTVKVKTHGDGTLTFDITCHNSRGKTAHREKFLLPPKSPLQGLVKKGKRVRVLFEKTGRDRDRPVSIELMN